VKKFLLRLLIAILFLAGALISVSGFLLGTDTGTAWTLRQVQARMPGVFKVGDIEGHLLDRLVLTDLSLSLEVGEIKVARLLLDWSPTALMRKEIFVLELKAEALRYTAKPMVLEFPIALPAIDLPLGVRIGHAEVTDAVIETAPGATPLVVDTAQLAARWDKQGVVIEQLDIQGPGRSLAVSGRIDPADSYALSLENRVKIDLEEIPHIDIQGSIVGNIDRLMLAQKFSGDARLDLNAVLDKPLEKPHWRAELLLYEIPGTLLDPALPLVLDGKLNAAGDLTQAALSGAVAANSETESAYNLNARFDLEADLSLEQLKVSQLEVTHREQPARISLSGTVASDLAVDIKGDWEALQWPIADAPLAQSRNGELSILGTLSDYRLTLGAHVEGQDIPAGLWSLAGRGNSEKLHLESLKGELLEGELVMDGDITWAPQVKWNLNLRADNIKPDSLLPELKGVVNLSANTEGSLTDRGPEVQLVLERLAGELNSFPLMGTGRIFYSNDRIDIEKLTISSADAKLHANGIVSEQSDLQWELQVPQLDHLLAGSGGRLSSQGKLSGRQTAPDIKGTFEATGLVFRTLGIKQLDVDFDLNLSESRHSLLLVKGTGLTVGENVVEQFNLEANGLSGKHELLLAATHAEAEIKTRLQGGYDGKQWAGTLQQLDLESNPLGPWRLQQPVELLLGPENAQAESLCLARDKSRLCAEGEWQATGSSRVVFNLAALPLSWLKPHLPRDISDISGSLTAKGEVQHGRTLKADISATVTPGELIVVTANDELHVPHSGVELEIHTTEQGAAGTLKTGFGSGKLTAKFNTPDLLGVEDYMDARVAANIGIEAPDLAFIPLLAPQFSEVEGDISAKFDLAGRLGRPSVRGNGRLALSTLSLPELGLRISDSRLDLKVLDNRLSIDGELVSGNKIAIKGNLALDSEKDWPLTLTLAGEKFILADLPNLQVVVSPDLKIESAQGAFALTGSLAIPKAEIIIRDLPAGARSASSDVIVVGEDISSEADTEVTTPLSTNVTVELGNEFHVAALGLHALLRGEVTLRGNPHQQLLASGDIRIDNGTFRAYSQDLEIERGIISYTNSPLDNPGLNVRAIRTIGDVVVGVNALGTARRTTITTFSIPSMAESDRIAYLVTGSAAGRGAKLSLDRQIRSDISVGVAVDTRTRESSFVTRYRINRSFHTEMTSRASGSALDLFYTIERE
jgi:translocation and assembly module TamB